MFVHHRRKVKRFRGKITDMRLISARMPKKEPKTEELRQVQHERTTDEHEALERAATPDEAHQHKRRAAKSAYLERKLAERERSERERKG